MKRREFITLIGSSAAAWPLPARAQELARSYRVAYLALVGDQDALIVKQRLDELGYSEGKNFIFDFRSAEGRLERLPQLAAELVATNPDVIVTGFGTETAKAAQAATTTIPIIFTSAGDPIGAGIVKSLNRPGANITGINSQTVEVSGKRLQILEELAPGIRIVAVIVSPDNAFTTVALPQLRIAANARDLRLEICEVRTADQLPASIKAAVKAGATGLTILETPILYGLRRQIADLAAELRLFAIYTSRDFVDAGGLISYAADRRQQMIVADMNASLCPKVFDRHGPDAHGAPVNLSLEAKHHEVSQRGAARRRDGERGQRPISTMQPPQTGHRSIR